MGILIKTKNIQKGKEMIRDNEKLMAEIGRIAEVAGYLW
jgi:hypothetical protein